MSTYEEELLKCIAYANQVLEENMPTAGNYDKELVEAMRYSVLAGGKRIRPILIDAFARLYDADPKETAVFMAAMEMIHTYSLVHDDLPALDNDMLRRGNPTTHAKYGEALGILAGDGLLHEAFYLATKPLWEGSVSAQYAQALHLLAAYSGRTGMLGGQTADVIHTGTTIADDLLMYIYDKKTGALLAGSMVIGAALGGAPEEELKLIEQAGALIGMAFQIQDDILDAMGDEAILGKPIHSDEKNDKKTYLTVHGYDKSLQDVSLYTQKAVEIIKALSKDSAQTDFICELFLRLIKRDK